MGPWYCRLFFYSPFQGSENLDCAWPVYDVGGGVNCFIPAHSARRCAETVGLPGRLPASNTVSSIDLLSNL